MLRLSGLKTFYGDSQVLFGVDLLVGSGEVVSLLGRNGMGKTTTVSSIMGLLDQRSGSIVFDGAEMIQWPSHQVARAGIGLVPEGRRIFPNLTVRENLVATAAVGADGARTWTLDAVLEIFPRLGERLTHLGTELSGGEQQMLAIGRALMTNPRLLVLDEATEGLAPLVREEIWSVLARLKRSGQSILVIDKNVQRLMSLADRHYVIEKGLIVWQGNSEDLRRDGGLHERYLGI
jgi:branched-chain amino acid transport system ATP-binding protein